MSEQGENFRLIPAGFILFAGDYCDEHIEAAKAYARDNNFQKGDVKIMPNVQRWEYGGQTHEYKSVIVKALRPIYVECAIQREGVENGN